MQLWRLSPKSDESMWQFKSIGHQVAVEPGRAGVPAQWCQGGEFSLIEGGSDFFVQLIGWGPPTSGMAICFTQSTDISIPPIQKHLHRTIRNNIWSNSWALWDPVKLTQKLHHHRSFLPQLFCQPQHLQPAYNSLWPLNFRLMLFL